MRACFSLELKRVLASKMALGGQLLHIRKLISKRLDRDEQGAGIHASVSCPLVEYADHRARPHDLNRRSIGVAHCVILHLLLCPALCQNIHQSWAFSAVVSSQTKKIQKYKSSAKKSSKTLIWHCGRSFIVNVDMCWSTTFCLMQEQC